MPAASKPTKKTNRKLTVKQLKFIKAKAEGKTNTDAAMTAYGIDYNSARALGSENMTKLSIQEAVNIAMAKQGITIDAIVKPIADGLEASKQNEYTGEVVIDHSIRLKSSSLAAQFLGIGKQPSEGGGVHFHQHLGDKREAYN